MSIFVYHSYDYKLNWTPFSPITTINNIVGSVENWNLDIDHRSERFNTVLCQHIYAVLTCTISLSAVLPRDERRTVSPSSSSMAVMRNNESVGYDKLMVYFHKSLNYLVAHDFQNIEQFLSRKNTYPTQTMQLYHRNLTWSSQYEVTWSIVTQSHVAKAA